MDLSPVMRQVIAYAKGNPGALVCLTDYLNKPDGRAIKFFSFLESNPSVRGTDIYILYSDLGGKDKKKVHEILTKVPHDIVVEAASKQDYSGRELIKPYLVEETNDHGIDYHEL